MEQNAAANVDGRGNRAADVAEPLIDLQATSNRTIRPDHNFATLSSLAQKADQLFSALEQSEASQFQCAGESKRKKSGQFRVGGEVPCRKYVPWPHDLCFVGVDCHRVTYDELLPLQWMCGFVHTILKSPSEYHLNLLLYVSDLLQNTLDLCNRKGAVQSFDD